MGMCSILTVLIHRRRMSAHTSTHHTIKTEAVGHGLRTPQRYSPYASQPTPWKEEVHPEFDDYLPPQLGATPKSKRSYYEGLADFYEALSWTLGFKEKSSLILC